MAHSARRLNTAAAMKAAGVSGDSGDVSRYRELARDAYSAALELFLLTPMTRQQEDEVWARIAPIREWLEATRVVKR